MTDRLGNPDPKEPGEIGWAANAPAPAPVVVEVVSVPVEPEAAPEPEPELSAPGDLSADVSAPLAAPEQEG